MDESADAYSSARDASGVESGSDAGAGGSGCGGGGGGPGSASGGGGGGSVVALTLAASASPEARATREERAAKALQTAARVMLARKGRFERLARETSALLLIQKRSREWLLKQKQHQPQPQHQPLQLQPHVSVSDGGGSVSSVDNSAFSQGL